MRVPFRAFTLCVCVCVQLVPGLAEEAEAGVDSEPVEAHREAVPSTHTAARDDEVADIILAAIGDAHSQDALIALFGGLTKALTARTPGRAMWPGRSAHSSRRSRTPRTPSEGVCV